MCHFLNGRWENITTGRLCRESEGAIVVLTPGNAGRAKGLCRKCVSTRGEEIRLADRESSARRRLKFGGSCMGSNRFVSFAFDREIRWVVSFQSMSMARRFLSI